MNTIIRLISLVLLVKYVAVLDAQCAWIELSCGYSYCPKVPDRACYYVFQEERVKESRKFECTGSTPRSKNYDNWIYEGKGSDRCDDSGDERSISYDDNEYKSYDCNGCGEHCPSIRYDSWCEFDSFDSDYPVCYGDHIIIIDLCLNHAITSIDNDSNLVITAYDSEDCKEITAYSSRIIADANRVYIESITYPNNTTKCMDDEFSSSGSGGAGSGGSGSGGSGSGGSGSGGSGSGVLIISVTIVCLLALVVFISILVCRRYKKANLMHAVPTKDTSIDSLNEIATEDVNIVEHNEGN